MIPFGLCPWAKAAWQAGQTRSAVSQEPAPTPDEVVAFARRLEGSPVVIGFLLAPRFAGRPAAWEKLAELARGALKQAGLAWHVAAFHPRFPAPFTTAANLVSSLRRSPDPLLQLVSWSALADLGADRDVVSAGVAARNFATATARTAELEAAFRRLLGG